MSHEPTFERPPTAGTRASPPPDDAGPSAPAIGNPEVARMIAFALEAPQQEGAGTDVGHYKLLQEIGEGGFGVVWMAEQQRPMRRRVAFKIIKRGMDTGEVIARFEAERQALALMDHPNIARVLDAGETASGRPYFVMELVRGMPITRYCDAQRLPLEERLKLFIPVCHAVQHAHQKGVIHRDLKPSNILVTLHDGVPVPKVIDFGIAKAIAGPLTEHTLFTQFHAFLGTPAYTSPEQMEMSGLDVDTRSDIYSLGVLLYELLTGRPPFDPEELRKSSLDGMRAIIREREPPRPSQQVRSLDDASRTSAARERAIDVARLAPALRGDLDWIVLRCLEKDRTHRYATASGLASDIRRFLAQEPVSARPPSTTYRVAKFIRRHHLGVAAGASVALALVAGTIVSTLALVRENAAHQRESRLRAEAVARSTEAAASAARSAQVAQLMQDILRGVSPGATNANDAEARRAILDAAVRRIDAELAGEPGLAASLRVTLGSVYRDLGYYETAEALLRQAITALRAAGTAGRTELATALDQLGLTLVLSDRISAAVEPLTEALALRETIFGRRHVATAETLFNLSKTQADPNDVRRMREEVLDIRRALLPQDDPDTADTVFGLATNALQLGQVERSLELHREALAIRRRVLGPQHPDVALSLHAMGLTLVSDDQMTAARQAFREAVMIRRKALGDAHPLVVTSLLRFAGATPAAELDDTTVEAIGEIVEAQRLALPRSAPALAAALLVDASVREFRDHDTFRAEQLAIEAAELATMAESRGIPYDFHVPADLTLFINFKYIVGVPAEGVRLAETYRAVMQRAEGSAFRERNLPRVTASLAPVYASLGRHAEAARCFEEVLAHQDRAKSLSFGGAVLRASGSESLRRSGRLDDAWTLIQSYFSAADITPVAPFANLRTGSEPVLFELGELAIARGEVELAVAAFRRACELAAQAPRQTNKFLSIPYPVERLAGGLARALARAGQAAEAERIGREALGSFEEKLARGQSDPMHLVDELRDGLDLIRAISPEAGVARPSSPRHGVSVVPGLDDGFPDEP